MWRLFQSEPVLMLIGGSAMLLPAIFEALASFDVVLTPRQTMALTSLVTIVAGVIARARVSPVRPT